MTTASTELEQLAEEIAEMGPWAVWCGFPIPEGVPPAVPRTGWVHEGRRPFRVITSADPFLLPRVRGMECRLYTGSEPTVDVYVWLTSGMLR